MAVETRDRPATRVLRLWRVYAYLDFMWITRDFRFFIICILSDFILRIGSITAVFLLAERFNGIGAWTQPQIIFMLGYATAVTGVMDTFFSYNILHISRRVGRGQMDHVLVQPRPVWLTLLTEGFMPFTGSSILITGLALMAWAVTKLGIPVSVSWLALVAVHIAASSTVMLSFSYLCGSLAFWAPRAAEEISSAAVDTMSSLKPFPLDGVSPVLAVSLLTVVPVGLIAWYPCRFLLGIDPRPMAGLTTPLGAIALGLLALAAFAKGLHYYEQRGSQRYHPGGHRS